MRLHSNAAVASLANSRILGAASVRRDVSRGITMRCATTIISLLACLAFCGCSTPHRRDNASIGPPSAQAQSVTNAVIIPFPETTAFDDEPAARAAFMRGYEGGYSEGLSGRTGWACTPSQSITAVASVSGYNRGRLAGYLEWKDRRFAVEFLEQWGRVFGASPEQVAERKKMLADYFRSGGRSEAWIESAIPK